MMLIQIVIKKTFFSTVQGYKRNFETFNLKALLEEVLLLPKLLHTRIGAYSEQ